MKRAMNQRLLIGFAVVGLTCGTALAQTNAPTAVEKSKPRTTTAKRKPLDPQRQRRSIIFNILGEAHAAAAELPTEQRVEILKGICGFTFATMDRRPMSISQSKPVGSLADPNEHEDPGVHDWAEELYREADELPGGSYTKLEAQSSAVRAMLPVDDKRALEMLDGLEASDSSAAQEQRNYLAVHVFSEMQQRHGDSVVPELRSRAQAMGESGQYPYGAMAGVSRGLKNVDTVRSIFNDALTSFQHSGDKLNAMVSMLALLRVTRDRLEPWQIHEAALQIADRLRSEIDRERRAYEEGGKMRPGLILIAEGVRDGLREIEPDLLTTIPALPPYQTAPVRQTVGNDSPTVTTSPELKKLKSDFDKTSTRLMEMSESEIHEGPELRLLIEKGVDQGAELLRFSVKDAKDHLSALQSAMPPVTDFVQVASRTNPSMTLAAVRKVQDSEVRARLLLTVAVGLPR